MAKYCCTLPYNRKPYPLEKFTVRGFWDRLSSAGQASRQPMALPNRLSKASRPNSRGVICQERVVHLQTKYNTRNTICPAKKK